MRRAPTPNTSHRLQQYLLSLSPPRPFSLIRKCLILLAVPACMHEHPRGVALARDEQPVSPLSELHDRFDQPDKPNRPYH